MRIVMILLCAIALSIPSPAAEHPRLHEYRRKIFTPQSAARSAAAAGINTARNTPHEWGRGAGGFAKRGASSFGQHIVKGTIEFGVGALHHENLHYQRSNLHGTMPRLGYAVKSTFIVPRTNRPGKTLAAGRIAGNMGGGLVSRAWMPASSAGIGAGVASGGIGLGADVGANVAREFWPRKKHTQARVRRHT